MILLVMLLWNSPSWLMNCITPNYSNHICAVEIFFVNMKPLTKIVLTHLPNDNTKNVLSQGDIQLSNSLVLQDVLYILTFKHNLLSVSKLSKNNLINFSFYPNFCVLQDERTKRVIIVGRMRGQLYIPNSKSFSPDIIQVGFKFVSEFDTYVNQCFVNNGNILVWHQRMGHP